MTLKELYSEIGGDYEGALRVLRVEKLMDKHIRRFPQNTAVSTLLEAKPTQPAALFDAAHAVKGLCSNLGLTKLCEEATFLTEEFRPGVTRKLTDDEVLAHLATFRALYERAADGILRYEKG